MVKLQLVLGVVSFVLWVFCLVEAISTPSDRVRNLPKVAWVLLVLFFPLVGSLAWLVAGRPPGGPRRRTRTSRAAFPEYERPGRLTPADPVKDAEFLRQVRERAEEQRRRHEEQRRQEEQRRREQAEPQPDPEPDPG